MEQIFLSGIKVEQLLERIGQLLDSRLNSTASQNDQSQSIYLSRIEVATLLKISLPTLHDWTKLGWLPSYKMGNRVLYKPEEIEKAIKEKLIGKHKRNVL